MTGREARQVPKQTGAQSAMGTKMRQIQDLDEANDQRLRFESDTDPATPAGVSVPVDGSLNIQAAESASGTVGTSARSGTTGTVTSTDGLAPSVRDPKDWVPRQRITPLWRRKYTLAVAASDGVIALTAALLGITVDSGSPSAWASVPFAVMFVAALTLGRVYEHRFIGAGWEEFRRTLSAGIAVIALLSTVAYAFDLPWRGLVLIGSPVALAGALLNHLVARQLLFTLRRRGRCQQRVVVIGTERSVAEMIRALTASPDRGVTVVAACVSTSLGHEIEGVPVDGDPAQAVSVLRRRYGDSIVLTAWSDVSEDQLRRLSWALEGSGAQLLVAPRITEVSAPRLHVQNVGGRALLTVEEPEFHGLRRLAKGALDYGLTSIGLLALSPVLLVVALAVRLDSRGPVFFRQERVGKNGVPFRMTKFRSMYVDAEQRLAEIAHLNEHDQGPMFKMKDDPRVTRVGAFLRRYSIDELPQLFDVLAGKMSLVGPRPPLPREVAVYEKETHRRLLVKPGITGLWQVSGRSDLSWEESVRLDLSYVENWSLGLDLSIIFRTVTAVLAQRGAY